MKNWMDVSNYSQLFSQDQLDFIRTGDWGVCIGLQDAIKARDFRDQCHSINAVIDYYVERPNRHIEIVDDPEGMVWVDIEPGCFVERNEANHERQRLRDAGLVPGIYGNKYSIAAVIGDSTEWASDPLWYANYPNDHHVPDLSEFVPFNGWDRPWGWQYSSLGIAGINCDLSIEYGWQHPQIVVPAGIGAHYTDGSDEEIWTPRAGKELDGVGIRFSDDTQRTVWP